MDKGTSPQTSTGADAPRDLAERLIRAVARQNIPRVRALLDAGALQQLRSIDLWSTWGDQWYAALEGIVQRGNLELLRLLLERKAPVSLGWAIRLGNLELVRLLLDQGWSLEKADVEQYEIGYSWVDADVSALALAVGASQLEIAKFLLERGASPKLGHDGGTVLGGPLLAIAAKARNLAMVQLLLDAGAEIGYALASALWHECTTPTDIALVRLLLDAGADPNLPDYRRSPLGEAILQKNYEVAELLLDRGADPNGKTEWGSNGLEPVLEIAARRQDARMVRLLLAKGARPSATTLHNALYIPSTDGEVLDVVLDAGVDITDPALAYAVYSNSVRNLETLLDRGGKLSPELLGYALAQRNTAAVELLLQRGADPNAFVQGQNWPWCYGQRSSLPSDETAVSIAAETGDLILLGRLLEAGGDPNLCRGEGRAPLGAASSSVGASRFLLEHGAQCLGATCGDYHNLSWIAGQGRVEVVGLLLAYGAEVNANDPSGRTALQRALESTGTLPERLATCRLLLVRGADPNARTPEGTTPLRIAEDRAELEMAQLLQEHGAKFIARQ